jgi:alkyldihydroxyacetonephosphate synthase
VAMMPRVDPPLASLIERLPPGTVSTHPGEVAVHAGDRWALAMLRDARGDRVPPPAAVVFASTTEHVATTLAWAQETGAAIVPRGGGTGLVGGAEAIQRSVVIDLSRMDRILAVDDVSQTVTAQAAVKGGFLEAALATRGLTSGHDPDSLAASTVGGWIASRSAGSASAGYGTIEDMVVGLTVVLGGGEVVRLGAIPRGGPGPDLRRLFVGSEGVLGIVTEATLAVSRAPKEYLWDTLRPNSFESGAALIREVVQRRFRPLVMRLLDADEAAFVFEGLGHTGAALVIGFDGDAPAAAAQWFHLRELGKQFGARSLGPELAQHWWDHRYDSFGWYQGVMGPPRTMGSGVLVDFLDTACLWRHVPRLYEDVRGALLDHAEAVRCRLPHAYPSGGSLHFTFVLRGGDDEEAERLYESAWKDAAAACLAAGATIAHDHGVGVLKVPFAAEELGPAGADALRRIKRALDPRGVLNPGKLLPPDSR